METIKNLARKWNDISLIKRILIGLAVGIILALICPGIEWIDLFGTIFVNALKAVAPVLVFFLVIGALSNAKGAKGMGTIVILYVVSTFVAALVAVIATYIVPLEVTLAGVAEKSTAPSGVGEVLVSLITNAVANPVGALVNANYLGILLWAVMLGIAFRKASENTRSLFQNIADAVSTVVRWVISFAPFGVMGLIYTNISTNGLEIFTEYGALILELVICMLVIALITNPLMVWICLRKNPFPLVLRCLKDSGLTAFFTRSSAANIPVNMELCRKLGLNKDIYGVSIPLGATINMAGAAVTITVMAMTAANTQGIAVSPVIAVILCVMASISACGASGVAGGSLLLIPLACSLLGIPDTISMQMVAIGFIIGVVQDSCETGLNSSSDVLFTATVDYMERQKQGIPFKLGKDEFSEDELA